MESTNKTNLQLITPESVKNLLLDFYSKQENMNLIDYYSRATFFDLIKKSRSETVHSAFLAWILEGSDFPNRGLSSNLMHFLQLLVSRKNNGQGDSDFDDGLKDAICTGTLELNDISIETEKPVQDFNSNANSKDRLDIYISCNTNLDKQLEIFIENKVGSKEGEPHKTRSKKGESPEAGSKEGESPEGDNNKDYNKLYQTDRYYNVCHDADKIQLFVFLSAISKSKLDDFSNFKEKDGKCKCKNFIHICYQDVLERILLPIKTLPNISSRTYNMIEEYISCLGIPAIEDNNNTSVKNQIIMAIPEEERERLRTFFETNQKLLTMTLDVVALNKIYYINNGKWQTIIEVFEKCLNSLLENNTFNESELNEIGIIKKTKNNKSGSTKYSVDKKGTLKARNEFREYLEKKNYKITEISSEIQSLLNSFWERNQTLLLVALKVLSDDKDNKKDNAGIDYEDCYNKLTSRDYSKFTIGDEEDLGKTDVVVKFVEHLLNNNKSQNEDSCTFINKYLKDVTKGPSKKGVLLDEDNYSLFKTDEEEAVKKDEKKIPASDRFRAISISNSKETYYISTQWGGQYNSTVKTDNFPKLWKKIKEYNNDEKNKNKFLVKPTRK